MVDSNDALATLVRAKDQIEASIIVNRLAEEEIDASATGTFTAGFLAEAPGEVSILVREEDLSRAREVIGKSSNPWIQENSNKGSQSSLFLAITILVLFLTILSF